MAAHVLPIHKKGDTFPGELFRMIEMVAGVPTPINLLGVEIMMDLRAKATGPLVMRFSNTMLDPVPPCPVGTLSITDAAGGEWQIDKQVIDLTPGTYMYDVQFSFPHDPMDPADIQTLIEGTWSINQDITYE